MRREAQKESVASRAPPRRDWGAARRASQSASKRPDLRSIVSSKKRVCPPWEGRKKFQQRIKTPSWHPQEAVVQSPSPLVFRGAAVSNEMLRVLTSIVSDFGSHSRSVLSSQDANDRRFPHGLGCGLGWPSSPRDLERPSS